MKECDFEVDGLLQDVTGCDLEDDKAGISILDPWSEILLSCLWLVEHEEEQLKIVVPGREAIAAWAVGGVYGIDGRTAWVRM